MTHHRPDQDGGGRRRPPLWWPENEPWPPPNGWPDARRRFVRRVALMMVGFVLLIALVGAIWTAFSPYHRAPAATPGFAPWVPLVLIIVVVSIVARRIIRRTAAPIGDVMDAANRLAGGDYSARVKERGEGEVGQLIDSFNQMAERLQANEGERQSLLAEVAHELRSPLSITRGGIEGMLDGVYPRDDPHLQSALDGTKRAIHLLEDLQTLSTAQAGALTLHREPTDLAALIEEVRVTFAPAAAARGLTLSVEGEKMPLIEVDPARLRQVFDNLVSNALRFTPQKGSVVLGCRRDSGFVVCFVSDTGSGIPPEELAHIFERFSRSADAKGSGLGLAVARSLVEAHGGGIRAESEPGRGTVISFWLPAVPRS